jgi:hypothetical protein
MNFLTRALLILCTALLGACSTVVKVSQPDAPLVPLALAQQGYAAVLLKHVNDQGEVDLSALRDDKSASGLPSLEAYVHMINAYNALSMYNVIASGIPNSHAGFSKVTFFLLRKFDIGGTAISLFALENDIIRKLNDPRVHFALNCSAVSCPVLPRTPFTADQLNAELDRETRAFFARPENLRIDHTQRTVYFNEILKFYTEDFTPTHAPSLIAYAQSYSSQALPADYQVAFIPYDWTVANSRRKR